MSNPNQKGGNANQTASRDEADKKRTEDAGKPATGAEVRTNVPATPPAQPVDKQDDDKVEVAKPEEAPVATATAEEDVVVQEPVVETSARVFEAPVADAPADKVEGRDVKSTDRWTQERLSDNQFRMFMSLPSGAKNAINGVLLYVEEMDPKKVMGHEKGVKHQISLYHHVTSLLNNTDAKFNTAVNLLLSIVQANKDGGVFDTYNVTRFLASMPIRKSDVDLFRRLFITFFRTSDIKERRETVKMMDLSQEFFGKDNSPTNVSVQAKDRLIAFYHDN